MEFEEIIKLNQKESSVIESIPVKTTVVTTNPFMQRIFSLFGAKGMTILSSLPHHFISIFHMRDQLQADMKCMNDFSIDNKTFTSFANAVEKSIKIQYDVCVSMFQFISDTENQNRVLSKIEAPTFKNITKEIDGKITAISNIKQRLRAKSVFAKTKLERENTLAILKQHNNIASLTNESKRFSVIARKWFRTFIMRSLKCFQNEACMCDVPAQCHVLFAFKDVMTPSLIVEFMIHEDVQKFVRSEICNS